MSHKLDARGLICPLPLLKLKLKLKDLNQGDKIQIIVSDTGSRADIPKWANKMGYEVSINKLSSHETEINIKI
ncbi:sulfurtransferase TusA family protein [Algibacillus agarilyticus]|uniref:sulfurtransferase TusA family protein n=1 Tax=Algibacillus agarilyticus TaxID=2234133 RepID=UPI000DCF69FA|nr:sulfurtransferase TusA family protein [Algibacillus agarilyticus]